MEDWSVTPLPDEKISEAATLLAEAFIQSPFWTYIFPKEEESTNDHPTRLESMRYIFQVNLRIRSQKKNHTTDANAVNWCVLASDGSLVCVFNLVPQDKADLGIMEMISHGLLTLPIRIGLGATRRLLVCKDFVEGLSRTHLDPLSRSIGIGGPNSSFQLQRMAVRPDYQGKGIGSMALRQSLARLGTNCVVTLETQDETNVVFYQRLGFRVVHKEDFIVKNGSDRLFTNYLMAKTASS